MRNEDRDERDHRADNRKQIEEIPLGVSAAALDPAHVVDQHEATYDTAVVLDCHARHVYRPAWQLQQRCLAGLDGIAAIAGNSIWVGLRLVEQPVVPVTKPDGKEPFVLNDPVKIGEQFRFGFGGKKFYDWAFHHSTDEF